MEGECSICLETLLIGKTAKLSCGHYFHTQCIDTWFEHKKICPLCRHQFKHSYKCKSMNYSFIHYTLLIESDRLIVRGLFYNKHIKFDFISKVGYIRDCFIIYYKNKIIKYKLYSHEDTFELFNILKNKFLLQE